MGFRVVTGKDDSGLELGVYGQKPETPLFGVGEIIAAALTVIWLVGVGIVLLIGSQDGVVSSLLYAIALLMPVALIWTVMIALKTAKRLRTEAAHLQGSIDALRHAHVILNQAVGMPVKPQPNAAAARDPISTRPDTTPAAAPSDPQPSLALETEDPPHNPISVEDFIRAMNFPNDENDRDGFRALKRAFADPDTSKLIRASQDILTLLSQDGIYMDDLAPDRARPEIWRQFAEGERGGAVAALGGVRERTSLALVTNRIREDIVFRDATHHFLRYFDLVLADFAPIATDQEIADMAETRTARAFMLLGRASGTFD